MEDANHNCTQERVLATMCEQLKNIENDIRDIKDGQAMFVLGLNAAQINSAKYPPPEAVNKQFAKVDRHDTYFQIIGAAVLAAWALLLFCADKLWRG
jgi:hypothetical protein